MPPGAAAARVLPPRMSMSPSIPQAIQMLAPASLVNVADFTAAITAQMGRGAEGPGEGGLPFAAPLSPVGEVTSGQDAPLRAATQYGTHTHAQ